MQAGCKVVGLWSGSCWQPGVQTLVSLTEERERKKKKLFLYYLISSSPEQLNRDISVSVRKHAAAGFVFIQPGADADDSALTVWETLGLRRLHTLLDDNFEAL